MRAGSPFPQLADKSWSSCLDRTTQDLQFVTSTLYVDKYISPADEKRIGDLMKAFKEELRQLLDKNQWMDKETKKLAKEKARAIEAHIVEDQMSGKPQELDNTYETLKVTDDPSVNLVNVLKFTANVVNKKVHVQAETKDKIALRTELEVNASYQPWNNQIHILAGILQKPLFDRTFPASLLFGAIGYIIGHEHMHGFDSQGRHYDKDGNMVNWWSKQAAQEFTKRAQCLIDEYSSEVIFLIHTV